MKSFIVFAAILAVCLAEAPAPAEEQKEVAPSKEKRGIFGAYGYGYGLPYYGGYGGFDYPYHGSYGYPYHSAPLYSKPLVSYHAPIYSKSYVLPSYHAPLKSYYPYHAPYSYPYFH